MRMISGPVIHKADLFKLKIIPKYIFVCTGGSAALTQFY